MTDKALLATPVGFTRKILGLDLYDWQARALLPLEDLRGRVKTAVASPNGAGKSERIVAPSALYVAYSFLRGRVAITTASSRQLNEQIIPAIEAHLPKFEGWTSIRSPYYRVTTPTGGSISAVVTDDAGRVEGLHQQLPDSPLLWIEDEAKSINQEIDAGVDRCTYTWKILTSSPGLMLGFFYDAFTNAALGYKTIRAGLKDCPHIPAEKIKDIINSYGENHPFTRSSVYGEFMEQDEANRYIVPLSSLERCVNNPPPSRPGIRVAFCDFAAGGDENVIALREGNRISLEAHWREKDKLAAVGRFIQHFRRLNLKEGDIWGDAAAKDMLDLLMEAGWTIHRQNFGSPSKMDTYVSWGAQAWLEAANQIEKCEIILPNDETLKKQLCSRQKNINARGKFAIEEKYAMAKRNLPSPDRADAVVGALAVYDTSALYTKGIDLSEFSQRVEQDDYQEQMEEIGAWAGG